MKRGTPRHPKTRALARTLGVPLSHAVGILEMLWHFTAEYAPRGDIGRFADIDIAEEVAWEAEAEKLIDALVECGWLERDERHRLIVHDWAEHADDAVHMRLARAHELFADGRRPKLGRLARDERERILAHYERMAGDKDTAGKRTTSARQAAAERTPNASRAPAVRTESALPKPRPRPEPRPEPVCVADSVGGESTGSPTPCNPPPPNSSEPDGWDLEAGWEEFRREYPVERDVDAACRWYVSELTRARERDGPGADRRLHGEIMAGLRRHKASAAWRHRETGELQLEFIPSMLRFLGCPNGKPTVGRMYLDHPPPWKPPPKRGSKTEFLERLARGEDVDLQEPSPLAKRLAKEAS